MNHAKPTITLALILAVAATIPLLIPTTRAVADDAPATPVKIDDGKGAFATGKYHNLFTDVLGKSEAETHAKVDKAFNQLFHGDLQTQALFIPAGKNDNGPLAYIPDVQHTDIRSEGMSYGMMITVQLDKKEEFDALWNWSRTYMYHDDPKHPTYGYFSWEMNYDGTAISEGAAPDGEEYYAMALLFAANRWPGGKGIYDYKTQAMTLLHNIVHRESITGPTNAAGRKIPQPRIPTNPYDMGTIIVKPPEATTAPAAQPGAGAGILFPSRDRQEATNTSALRLASLQRSASPGGYEGFSSDLFTGETFDARASAHVGPDLFNIAAPAAPNTAPAQGGAPAGGPGARGGRAGRAGGGGGFGGGGFGRGPRNATTGNEFNEQYDMIRFVPDSGRGGNTDPSYHLPAFYELWARWGPPEDRDLWAKAAQASRDLYAKVANPQTGLCPNQCSFDGTGNSQFQEDAWRCAMNWTVDWSWFAKDPREQTRSDSLQKFLESQGMDTYGDWFQLDGRNTRNRHSPGLMATTGWASLAATNQDTRKKFTQAFWDMDIPSSEVFRYYDGLLYMMCLMDASAEYRAIMPKQ